MTQLETSRLTPAPVVRQRRPGPVPLGQGPGGGPLRRLGASHLRGKQPEIIRTVLSEEGTFAVLLKGGDGGPIGSVGVFPTAIPVGKGEPEIRPLDCPALLGAGACSRGRGGAAALAVSGDGSPARMVRPFPGK